MSQTDNLPITGWEDTGVRQKLLNLLYFIFIIIVANIIFIIIIITITISIIITSSCSR